MWSSKVSVSTAGFYLSLVLSLYWVGDARISSFYITGLFPTESKDIRTRNELGIYPKVAAKFAVARINQLGILDAHNVSLKLEVFDSHCQSSASGAHGLIQAVRFAKERGIHDTSNSGGENSAWLS